MRGKWSSKPAQWWTVYSVNAEKCYLDDHPMVGQSMQVDHIIPESMFRDSEELAKVLDLFIFPSDFSLNSYENWLPACPKHNNLKRARVPNGKFSRKSLY